MGDSDVGDGRLARRLSTFDAVVIGLSSMIGAGVFVAFAPAAAAAGAGLLVGLVVAGAVAYCNATSSAQLAAVYPTSGGTYIYGRERLGDWWGFLAGWGFIVGKTASCAAMAITFAAYAVPDPAWRTPIALAAVAGLAAVNYRGVTRTVRLARVLVALVLVVLAVVIVAGFAGDRAASVSEWSGTETGWYGLLQASGLLFFAFAGYARIATMGEEVKEPASTIPRAIVIALTMTIAIYLLVGTSVLVALGPDRLAQTTSPLVGAVEAVDWGWAAPLVRIGAAAAALGALLALIAGVGRTSLAMARERDLPAWLSGIHPRFRVPHHADIALAVAVGILVVTVDLRGAIGFSSFGVLIYYAIANLSALTQPRDQRHYPRAVQVAGLIGCLTLVATLPWQSVLAGVGVLVAGVVYRLLRLRRTNGDDK